VCTCERGWSVIVYVALDLCHQKSVKNECTNVMAVFVVYVANSSKYVGL
jgi:hypothetical protein